MGAILCFPKCRIRMIRRKIENYLTEHGYTITDVHNMIYNEDPTTWDALATGYEMSDDGLTYTFHIRQGIKWVDSQGREVADVKADDWVAGMQHMMDAMGGLEYLVEGIIVNASEYIMVKLPISHR